MPAPASLLVTVSGAVQGVGFRFFARDLAVRRGLVGYARNRPGGSVEVEVEGSRDQLDDFLKALREGPRYGKVTELTAEWGAPSGKYQAFMIRG
jgi:acylphosphatase